MQFRYYNVDMTTDDGEFTLKALEVTNRREEDGLAHMRVSSDCEWFMNHGLVQMKLIWHFL